MSGAQQGDVPGPAAEGANGDRDSVDDVIERLLSVRGERGEKGCSRARVAKRETPGSTCLRVCLVVNSSLPV